MYLDTSGLLCCLDASDQLHSKAVGYYDNASRLLTSNYILAEFVALAQARRLYRKSFLVFAERLVIDPNVELIWVDQVLHDEAMKLLQAQLDKSYSLCDAVSFLLMRQRNIVDALTTDHHFDQAGLRRLLPR